LVAISSPLPNYSLPSHIRFFKGNRANPARYPQVRPRSSDRLHLRAEQRSIQPRSWIRLTTRFVSQLHRLWLKKEDELLSCSLLMVCLGSLSRLPQVIRVASAAAAEGGRMCCVECRTTTTPMWRSGPTGPRVSSGLLSSPLLPLSLTFVCAVSCGGGDRRC
jgi:hypothetical protein